MNANATPEQAVAAALARLLADHPELSSIVWAVGERPGILSGHQMNDTGHGQVIDTCARAMGGTVARTVQDRNGDGHGLAQLVTTFDSVPVVVWASYPLPGRNGLTASEQQRILSRRQLGTLVFSEDGAL